MVTLIASSSGPKLFKSPSQSVSVLLDLQGLMTLPHETAVKLVGFDPSGANVIKSRCNAGRYVQLDLGPDAVAIPQRTLTLDVLTTERTLRATLLIES